MKLKIPFFVVLLLASLIGAAQYSEWKEFGLKGPVQSVTSRFYNSQNFQIENLQIPDSAAWTHKTVRFFNSRGMVEWYTSTNQYNLDTTTGIKTQRTSYVSYQFDTTFTKTGGAAYSKETVKNEIRTVSTEHYRYNWISPFKYMEEVYDSSGVTLLSTFEYELDTSFFIIQELHHYYWKNGSLQLTLEINYTKNHSDQIATCTERYDGDAVSSTKIYDYKSVDHYGNPTCFLVHVETATSSFDILAVKEYSYFSHQE